MDNLRRLIAGVLAAAALWLSPPAVELPCFAPTEDSSVAHCKFDPHKRYDYRGGFWLPTDRATAPTGAELTANPNPADD
jgi:hypothetical protein